MLDEPAFELPFLGLGGEREEVEAIEVLDHLLCQLRLRSRQSEREVRQGLALATIKAALNLVNQNLAAPAVLDGLPRVPQPLFERIQLF
jgi:hypothetical protein